MKVTNNFNLPDAIVNALKSDYKYKDKQFSVTTILQGIKSFLLTKRHSDAISMDASEGINMLLGTAVHAIFENNQNENELAEEYMKCQVDNGYCLSGKADLYNLETKELTDYKTCSVWKIIFKDFEDWHKQLLCYAWLIKQLDLDVKRARITALIKDWSKADLKKAKLKNEYYPETAIFNVDFDISDDDLNEIGQWINSRFKEIEKYETLCDDDIPTCSDEERWYSGTKYAVKKGNNIKAIRVFDTLEEANELAETNPDFHIELRKGINRKCEDYCNACEFCNFYKRIKEEQENGN